MVSPFPMAFWKTIAAAGITFGRHNAASMSGSFSGFTTTWTTGGAAASGTILVLQVASNVGGGVPSGGSTWTQVGTTGCWTKVCGGSEPTTYALSGSGSSKSDCMAYAITEIKGASAVDNTASSSTSTAASVTSSAASDAVTVSQQSTNTPPSGYSVLASVTDTVSATIAGKLSVGSGTVSPGSWSGSATGASVSAKV